MGTQSYTTAGTYSWTCPTGVSQVTVDAVGGGGSGGGGDTAGGGGGGGGGGGYNAGNFSVTAGNSYTIVVGNGGSFGTPSGSSYGVDVASTAYGGGGGSDSDGFGDGGSGGAGGSGSVSGTNGTAGGTNPGTGQGGNGGDAANFPGTGGASDSPGTNPGGGGGGADGGIGHSAGNGADGQVLLTWVATPVASFVFNPPTGTSPTTVGFADTSTNEPTSWLWERNSGSGWSSFSASQYPSQSFTTGTWSVRLTATNAAGSNTDTENNIITITPPSLTGGASQLMMQ